MILLSSCCNKKTVYLKPETITVYVDKYVPVPSNLTDPCQPVYEIYSQWLKNSTWIDLMLEHKRTIDHCNAKLEQIKILTNK